MASPAGSSTPIRSARKLRWASFTSSRRHRFAGLPEREVRELQFSLTGGPVLLLTRQNLSPCGQRSLRCADSSDPASRNSTVFRAETKNLHLVATFRDGNRRAQRDVTGWSASNERSGGRQPGKRPRARVTLVKRALRC